MTKEELELLEAIRERPRNRTCDYQDVNWLYDLVKRLVRELGEAREKNEQRGPGQRSPFRNSR